MAFPTKDAVLAAYSANFDTRISAVPVDFGLSAAQATVYHTKHLAFIAAYNAVLAAREAGTRSKSLTTSKNESKADLLRTGREYYHFIQNNTAVTDANKNLVGVVVIDNHPTPVPVPNAAPEMKVISVFGRTVKLSIKDASGARKGRPIGCAGAQLYSFVGATPPAGTAGWMSEGTIGRPVIDVQFPESVTPATKVWFTAAWFNPAKRTGPACTPISAYIGFEGAEPIAA